MWEEIVDSISHKSSKDSLIITLQQEELYSLRKQIDYKDEKIQNVKKINIELLDQIEKNDKKIRNQKIKSKFLTGVGTAIVIILTTIILTK